MRVIAGEFGRRRIKDVPGKTTRSTTDKIKEATFQRLGPFFEEGLCLDLFAGSGALGIEALSRGMTHAYFVDTHSKAIKIMYENIHSLQLENRCTIQKRHAIRALEQFSHENITFDLILIDPPYHSTIYEEALHKIHTYKLLNNQGIIYCEHDRQLNMSWEDIPFKVIHSSTYGTITTTLLSHEASE